MEVPIAIGVVALFGAAALAHFTRRRPGGNPEVRAALNAIKTGRWECGGRVVRDVADRGDMHIFNCLNPEFEKGFMIDMREEDDE